MFKKIRLLINKETRISRITEFYKWVGIFLTIYILLFITLLLITINFEGASLILLFVWLLATVLFVPTNLKDIYVYLYDTHPYTVKLNEELEEKNRQELEETQKKLEEDVRVKYIVKRKKEQQKDNEKRQRDETHSLDILIENKIQIKDAKDSLKRFRIIKEKVYTELSNQEKKEWLVLCEKELKEQEEALNNSPLVNYFGAIEGGETILYYLKLKNKFGETRYKIGVTLNSVEKRYSGRSDYKILYEKKLTHANTIEKKILKKFNHLITDESLLDTNGTEIFKEDILKLDTED